MRIFLDSSKVDEVDKWLPIISGITTNPIILQREGGDVEKLAEKIAPCPLSVEACGDFLTDARRYSNISNVVVKVPLLTTSGGSNIKVIETLINEGIKINCTALMSFSQVIIASQLGVQYASIFAGRIDDEGGDYFQAIKDCVDFLDDSDTGTELIVGSVRTVGNVLDAFRARAHIVTITPPILEKMVKHSNSKRTVIEFEEAYSRMGR
jgi:transaldolase